MSSESISISFEYDSSLFVNRAINAPFLLKAERLQAEIENINRAEKHILGFQI